MLLVGSAGVTVRGATDGLDVAVLVLLLLGFTTAPTIPARTPPSMTRTERKTTIRHVHTDIPQFWRSTFPLLEFKDQKVVPSELNLTTSATTTGLLFRS